MKKSIQEFMLPTLAGMSVMLLLLSCNKDYDLGNGILSDATLFEKVSVPIGDVEKITLDKLLFSKEDSGSGIQYRDNGDLYMDIIGGTASAEIEVPAINISGIELEDRNIMFNIPEQMVGVPTDMIDATIKYSDTVEGGLSYTMNLDMVSPLPEGIKNISEVYLDAELNCTFTISDGVMYVSEGFEFIFPEFLLISAEGSHGEYEVVDNHVVRFIKDAVLNTDSPLSVSLSLNQLSVSEDDLVTSADGSVKIMLTGAVDVKGDFYIKTKDYDVIPENIGISIKVFSDDIVVKKAKTSIGLDVEIPDEDIVIDDIPDILKGDNVCIDLYNPVIALTFENHSPFEFSLDADLTAYNGSESHDVHFGSYGEAGDQSVYVEALSSAVYHFSRRPLSSVPQGAKNIVLPVIGELIQEIPDRVSIHDLVIVPGDELVMVETGSHFDASMSYSMSAPLAFGENLSLIFEQDVELNLDLDVKIASADVKMDIISTIPIDFDIEAVCLDVAGNVLSHLAVDVNKIISAGTQDKPTVNEVVISIRNSAEDLDIDGLRLTMKATSVNPEFHGVCLNKNQGLEIKDIVLVLPDGIGLELNK